MRELTLIEYRTLVAYLRIWYPTLSLNQIFKDLNLKGTKEDILWQVEKCGYCWSDEEGLKWGDYNDEE